MKEEIERGESTCVIYLNPCITESVLRQAGVLESVETKVWMPVEGTNEI